MKTISEQELEESKKLLGELTQYFTKEYVNKVMNREFYPISKSKNKTTLKELERLTGDKADVWNTIAKKSAESEMYEWIKSQSFVVLPIDKRFQIVAVSQTGDKLPLAIFSRIEKAYKHIKKIQDRKL